MKVAIVHYWFVCWRGGENVIERFLKLFPDADIYTHVYCKELLKSKGVENKVGTTFISKIPFARKIYKKLVFFMPFALEQLDLTEYDLVISSESGPAKNIIVNPDALHICYCHSPMRYVWDMYHEYIDKAGVITRLFMRPLIHYLRIVDRLSADRGGLFCGEFKFCKKAYF